MKESAIFIDFRNIEHVRWFNKTASKLIRCTSYQPIVETATNETVGYIVIFKSLFKNHIIKENLKFIKNPTKVIIEKK